MEMRIVVPGAAAATRWPSGWVSSSAPSGSRLLADRREVDVRVEGESDHAVLRVLETVERWLDDTAAGSAEMWLGEHSYRIARWAPVEAWQ